MKIFKEGTRKSFTNCWQRNGVFLKDTRWIRGNPGRILSDFRMSGAGGETRTHDLGIMRTVGSFDPF